MIEMRHNHLKSALIAVAVAAVSLPLSSCFKDEPLNAEADIEKAYIHLDNPKEMFFNESDTLVEVFSAENQIVFNVRESADISAVPLRLKLTEGATVTPENGSVQDFSAGDVVYTVTSQDKQWKRHYTVHFNRVKRTITSEVLFDFEHYELTSFPKSNYYQWYNVNADGTKSYDWASGNAGFAISWKDAPPEDYPTVAVTGGKQGACVKLTTRSTGPLGKMVRMPIAAGNLFLGRFDASKAMKSLSEALQATMFGIPFDHKPIRMTGYYKYHPGEMYIDKNYKEQPSKTDAGDIYAVLYRNHDARGNALVLYGDNVLTSSQIVAIARIPKTETTSEWTFFDLPFVYTEEIDPTLLENRGYSLIVCFSSSIDGASFSGAIGSELFVDQVTIYTEKEEL